MHTYSILSVPFYDARLQQYTKILCINAAPVGPLAARVKTVRPPRLSGLSAPQNHPCNCLHALCCSSACGSSLSALGGSSLSALGGSSLSALGGSALGGSALGGSALGGSFLTPDDLPELFAFLATNGYTVDLGLTKLAAKHQPGSSSGANAHSLVCLISYK
jgi:hypothetical protein